MLIPSLWFAPMNFFAFGLMLMSGSWLNRTFPFLVFWIIGLIGLFVSVFLKTNKVRRTYIYILYASLVVSVLAAVYGFALGTFLSGIKVLPVSFYFYGFIIYAGAVFVAVWNLIRLRKCHSEICA